MSNRAFSRSDTQAIKGVGIVLMLMHHLWCFPSRIPVGYSVLWPVLRTSGGGDLLTFLGKSGQICVSLFMFLGGYGLYKQVSSGHFSLWNKIGRLYRAYWKVLFVFIPIAFIFFRSQLRLTDPSVHFYDLYLHFDPKLFIRTMFGLSFRWNREWWFLLGFASACVYGYLYILGTKNVRSLGAELSLLVLLTLLLRRVVPQLIDRESLRFISESPFYTTFFKTPCTVAYFSGIVAAKYDVLNALNERLLRCRTALRLSIAAAGCLAIPGIRTLSGALDYDFLLMPFFVSFLWALTGQFAPVKRALTRLGRHSMNMWLVHTFYCYYFSALARIVYGSRNAIIDLLVLILLSLGTSVLLNSLYRRLGSAAERLSAFARSAAPRWSLSVPTGSLRRFSQICLNSFTINKHQVNIQSLIFPLTNHYNVGAYLGGLSEENAPK